MRLRARLLLSGGRLSGLRAALLLGHAGLLALLSTLRALGFLAGLSRALLLAFSTLLLGGFLALCHAGLALLGLRALRLLAGLAGALLLALYALFLGALPFALRHTAALVLGSGALALGALLGGPLALTRLVARTGAGTALGLARLCACEGRACYQRRRRSRDPQCGLHANLSFPL